MLAGVADVRLQLVQNATARLVLDACRSDHMTPVLARLQYLLVCQRIVFKTVVVVWKSHHSVALAYLRDVCVSVSTASSAAFMFGNYWIAVCSVSLDGNGTAEFCRQWAERLEQFFGPEPV